MRGGYPHGGSTLDLRRGLSSPVRKCKKKRGVNITGWSTDEGASFLRS